MLRASQKTFGVDNPMLLERLLYVLAAQMTGVLSPTKLSKELEMGQPDQPGAELAIEVGSSDGHSRANLQAFAERYPRFEGGCWLITPDSPYLRPDRAMGGVGSMSLELFLLAASAQAERDLVARLGLRRRE